MLQTEKIDGVGSYPLAEYYFDSEPSPWPGSKIDLYTIGYLFCASSHSYLPKHIKDSLSLRGARVMFRRPNPERRWSMCCTDGAALGRHRNRCIRLARRP